MVAVDREKGRQILISLEDITATDEKDGWSVRAITSIKVQIPEINYVQIYTGDQQSPLGDYAVAYAVGDIVQQFLHDPVFQRYVQCREGS